MNKFKCTILVSSIMMIGFQGCGGSSSPIDSMDTKKTFYITSKTEFKPDENITTTYTYYAEKYLSQISKHSTDGWTDKKTYKYFENYKVMKTYDRKDNVESVATFSTLSNTDSAYLYDRRLSFDEEVKYLIFANDTLTHHNPYHIKKFITTHTTGNVYTYSNSDLLTKIENGSFEDNNAIDQLNNDANTSYLLSPLTFVSNQETRYDYDTDDILTGVTFEGQSGTLEADANVTLYSTGTLKELSLSTGDKFVYSSSGYLTKKITIKNGISSTENYTYSSDSKTITVKDANGDIAQQYTFSEIK